MSKASVRVKEGMLTNKRLASLAENVASTFKA